MPCRHAQQIQAVRQARAVREREVSACPRQIIAEYETQRAVGDARCILPGARHIEWSRTMIEGELQRRSMAGNPVE